MAGAGHRHGDRPSRVQSSLLLVCMMMMMIMMIMMMMMMIMVNITPPPCVRPSCWCTAPPPS